MKVLVVMPAYNAEKTLLRVLDIVPAGFPDLLLVDDASSDNTVSVARAAGIPVIEHEQNRGYGGNQKTCYNEALSRRADIVVMLHPDGQYDPSFIPSLIKPIQMGIADAVFGSRMSISDGALKGGMPWWKFISNKILSHAANQLTNSKFSEWHCGFRAYNRMCLETVLFRENSDDYDFDIEMTLKLLKKGARITEIPIPTIYTSEASSINFSRSVLYGLRFLRRTTQYKLGIYP